MVERFNRTLEAQLSKFVEDHQRDWDSHLPLLLMAYRTAIHETTGCTPASLMLGRDLRLPIDLLFGRPDQEPSSSISAYGESLEARLEQIHEFARDHLRLISDRMKERYDSTAEVTLLQRGDPVWLYNPQRKKGVTPKLMRPWQGPYVVIKRINDVVYRVQLGPKTKPKVVHRNRLWKYSGSAPPTWLDGGDSPTNVLPQSQTSHTPQLPRNSPRRSGRVRHSPDRFHF